LAFCAIIFEAPNKIQTEMENDKKMRPQGKLKRLHSFTMACFGWKKRMAFIRF
jgi:hypothetical protein